MVSLGRDLLILGFVKNILARLACFESPKYGLVRGAWEPETFNTSGIGVDKASTSDQTVPLKINTLGDLDSAP